MWENIKLREKRKEKAFMEETKTFQPKPTLYLPTDSFIFKRLYSFTVFILQQWDISKLNKITTTRIQKKCVELYGCFGNHFPKLHVKNDCDKSSFCQ